MVTEKTGRIIMLDPEKLIKQCVKGKDEVVITDLKWNIIYRTGVIKMSDAEWYEWTQSASRELSVGDFEEWEVADADTQVYYKVRTTCAAQDGETYLVHHMYDISDYAELFRELGNYSKEWKTLAQCQNEVISHLSGDYLACIPVARKYYKASICVVFVSSGDHYYRFVLRKDDEHASTEVISGKIPYMDGDDDMLVIPDIDPGKMLRCTYGTTVSGKAYALFISTDGEPDRRMYSMYDSIFKLYIENSILQAEIIYENEHDHLTGLYNRAKYSELSANEFSSGDSVAIFYLDLNYLKRTNDTMGHDAGNRLLLKAGRSISEVTDDKTLGFRIGGDEFVMTMVDITRQEAEAKQKQWAETLDRLNEEDKELECVVACGMIYAEAPYDFADLCVQADELMYQNKRKIKIARGDDPDAR